VLSLRIDFLNGVYHAADPDMPRLPEWPPAPDRIFQALVAAAYGGGHDPSPLRALEGQAPELRFGPARVLETGVCFVPAAYKAKQGRVSKFDPQMVEITDPVVVTWPEVPAECHAAIAAIAADLDYLGRAKSPVCASLIADPPALPFHLTATPRGEELLRVPHPGRLDELDAAFAAGRRAAVAGVVAYDEVRESAPASPWGLLLTRRLVRDVAVERTAQLTDALRQAVLSVGGDAASPLLHGHAGDHAAWTVLPNVGHRHARGEVLGLGLWLPRGIDLKEREHCALAFAGASYILLNGIRIALRDQTAHEPMPAGLQRSTWSRKARLWASVTPMVLDRHPKRGQRLETLIADSVEMAGYPRPSAVETGQDSPFKGTPSARRFRPRTQGRWLHVALAFDRAVQGPLLIGRDRHFGLGLLRPIQEREQETGHAA
jgi:CRISPR-associated protein Csb2